MARNANGSPVTARPYRTTTPVVARRDRCITAFLLWFEIASPSGNNGRRARASRGMGVTVPARPVSRRGNRWSHHFDSAGARHRRSAARDSSSDARQKRVLFSANALRHNSPYVLLKPAGVYASARNSFSSSASVIGSLAFGSPVMHSRSPVATILKPALSRARDRHRGELGDDVLAVPAVLDHRYDAAEMAVGASQAVEYQCECLVVSGRSSELERPQPWRRAHRGLPWRRLRT